MQAVGAKSGAVFLVVPDKALSVRCVYAILGPHSGCASCKLLSVAFSELGY